MRSSQAAGRHAVPVQRARAFPGGLQERQREVPGGGCLGGRGDARGVWGEVGLVIGSVDVGRQRRVGLGGSRGGREQPGRGGGQRGGGRSEHRPGRGPGGDRDRARGRGIAGDLGPCRPGPTPAEPPRGRANVKVAHGKGNPEGNRNRATAEGTEPENAGRRETRGRRRKGKNPAGKRETGGKPAGGTGGRAVRPQTTR